MSREVDDRDGEPDEARTRSLKTTLANLQSAYNGESENRRLILDCLSLIRVTTVRLTRADQSAPVTQDLPLTDPPG